MEPDSADQFLVEQIRAGDQGAWRQLIERYNGRLLAFARTRVPRTADAEDLVQEAFVGFVTSLPNYDAAQSLETYLFTILRHKLYDLLRKKKLPLVDVPAESEDWWDRVVPGTGETPSRIMAQAEAQRAREGILAEVLRKLIHEYRDRGAFDDLQIIELLFYGGWRNLQVGELLEIDQKVVAGVKFRAIQKLRKFLEGCEVALPEDDRAEVTVSKVWRERRLTCLKRSTLGSYVLGVLDDPWFSYTQFHLDVVGCPLCVANLQDLEGDESGKDPLPTDSIFASSVGFLSHASGSR
ncbi:MAG: sigma-70 family RNA polymerase sigma factor [Phycisphaerae bacterium]|nr:sigma-70 family RNA polymerase sigma factor [Phycisphaerae bacterium]